MSGVPQCLMAALAGRYTLQRELGRGGMATVYLAEDLKHRRPVAVKVLRPELAAVLGPERFLREIELSARLTHPNILPLHDSGRADGFLYYVMPYVEGESLRDRLAREKQLPVDDALQIAREVADALSYAHSHGVIHRDIKPENILLASGHAVVADFGIARAVDYAAGERITVTGLAVGTPVYMSPEQAAGSKELDGRSDLYSLGCVLYEMLAGEPPYTAPTGAAIVAKKLSEPTPRISVVRETVPASVEGALQKVLAKVPADRFATAHRFAAALAPGAAAVPVARTISRRARRAFAVALAVVAATAGIWAATGGIGGSDAPSPPPAATVSPDRLAILPFAVRGSGDLEYLSEGLVDLLSARLDGAGKWRTVNPYAVIGFVRRNAVVGDPQGAVRVAREFGAGMYLLGSVVGTGRRAMVSARIYDREGSVIAHAEAALEGEEQLIGVVDDVARQLIVGAVGVQGSRPTAMTTRSVPALRAYLQGEDAYRRGRYDSAAAAYTQAVAADTTFALAYYRLALLPSGFEPISQPDAIRHALRHEDRLGERDRALLEAVGAYLRGAGSDAERQLQGILEDYPSDVDAWHVFGTVLMRPVPVVPRPLSDVRAVLERALRLDPDNTESLYALVQLAGIEQRYEEAADLLGRLLVIAPQSDLAPMHRLALAYARRDRAEQRRLLARLTVEARRSFGVVASAYQIWTAVKEVLWASGDVRGAIEVARLLTEPTWPSEVQAFGHMVVTHLYLSLGQWRAAKAELDRYAALEVSPAFSSLTVRSILATLPFVPMTRRELETLRDTVGQVESASYWGVSYPFLAGLLSARLGDQAAVVRFATKVREYATTAPPATDKVASVFQREATADQWHAMPGDLALQVHATAAWFGRRPAESLALLDRTDNERWVSVAGQGGSYWVGQAAYMRAELLWALGRREEALPYYERFGRVPRDQIYVAPAHLRRAEFFEQHGEVDSAVYHYQRVIDLWKDADPELLPRVEEARAAVARLRG